MRKEQKKKKIIDLTNQMHSACSNLIVIVNKINNRNTLSSLLDALYTVHNVHYCTARAHTQINIRQCKIKMKDKKSRIENKQRNNSAICHIHIHDLGFTSLNNF